jgi:predicted RNA-binding protein with PIN domain
MYYLVDGYNLIFALIESKDSLTLQREKVIRYLQKKFAKLHLSGMIVFDGKHRRDEESGLSYPSPLIVGYAPKGLSADAYIVAEVEKAKNPKQVIVITNDKGLTRHVRAAGAKVQSNNDFILELKKRSLKTKAQESTPKESQHNIERLEKIFEERLRKGEDH